MLKTKKGTTLPAELFLHTVTSLGYEPGMLENLAQTSKTTRELLSHYEYSLTRKLAAPFDQRAKLSIRSSSPSRSCLIHSTYPWLHELHTRSMTVSFLKASPLLSQADSPYLQGTSSELGLLQIILDLLYDISDLGINNAENEVPSSARANRKVQRAEQEKWIFSEHRTEKDLAILYAMINIISDKWRSMLDEQKGLSSSEETACADASRPVNIPHYAQSSMVTPASADIESEQNSVFQIESARQREEECILRECMLMYGPFLLKASISVEGKYRDWFEEVMAEGLNELRSFEEGRFHDCKGSLQGVIMRRFCELVGCDRMDGWLEVWRVIDSLPLV